MKYLRVLALALTALAAPLIVLGSGFPQSPSTAITGQNPTPVWECRQCGYSTSSYFSPGKCPRDGNILWRRN